MNIGRFEPIRDKNERIPHWLLKPSAGFGNLFPASVGPRVIYLDSRYDHPTQTSDDSDDERLRQRKIWGQFTADRGVQFTDVHVDEDYGREAARAKREVAEELGADNTAQFFETVYSRLFGEPLDLVIMSAGVSRFNEIVYHDIGYLRQPGAPRREHLDYFRSNPY